MPGARKAEVKKRPATIQPWFNYLLHHPGIRPDAKRQKMSGIETSEQKPLRDSMNDLQNQIVSLVNKFETDSKVKCRSIDIGRIPTYGITKDIATIKIAFEI